MPEIGTIQTSNSLLTDICVLLPNEQNTINFRDLTNRTHIKKKKPEELFNFLDQINTSKRSLEQLHFTNMPKFK